MTAAWRLDAHTHLDLYEDAALTDRAIAEIDARRILTVAMSVDPAGYARTVALAARSRWIIPCFGIHPWQAHRFDDALAEHAAALAATPIIGEVGLDYVLDPDPAHHPAQRRVLAHMLRAAAISDRIVSLHTKGAEADVAAALQRHRVRRPIIHWYSGSHETLAALLEHGAWCSFGSAMPVSAELRALAAATPLERTLSETDNPGAAQWALGRVGLPGELDAVIAALGDIHGLSIDAMAAIIRDNWRRLIAGDARLAPWRVLLD